MAGLNRVLDRSEYLSLPEAKQLLDTVRKLAETASLYNHKTSIRDHFIIHLALATGLRVMEMAPLNCGDLFVHDWGDALAVRNGKGDKKRLVWFDSKFRQHYEDYLDWKRANDEPVVPPTAAHRQAAFIFLLFFLRRYVSFYLQSELSNPSMF